MEKIAVSSLESFKKRAAHLRPFTKNETHGQALELLAKLCGYPSYLEASKSNLQEGEPVSLNDVTNRLLDLVPGATWDAAFRACRNLNVHSAGAEDRYNPAPRTQTAKSPVSNVTSNVTKKTSPPTVAVVIKKTRRIPPGSGN